MKDNIIINKSEIISRCLKRVHEEYKKANGNFLTDYTRQDAALLNLQRAIQAAVDIASHVIRKKSFPVPLEMKDAFITLKNEKVLSEKVSKKMVSMVGFRNISMHEYQRLDMQITESVIKKHLVDFGEFIQEILAY